MTEEVFGQFLASGSILCLVMAAVSTFLRWKRYGAKALAMGIAFAVFGVLLYGLRNGWPLGAIVPIALVLVLLLAADALMRLGRETDS